LVGGVAGRAQHQDQRVRLEPFGPSGKLWLGQSEIPQWNRLQSGPWPERLWRRLTVPDSFVKRGLRLRPEWREKLPAALNTHV